MLLILIILCELGKTMCVFAHVSIATCWNVLGMKITAATCVLLGVGVGGCKPAAVQLKV